MKYKSFDDVNLLEHFNGDEVILLDMIHIFQNNLEELLIPIRDSIRLKNGDLLKLTAHTFKGVLSSFYAEEGRALAYELQLRGESKRFEDCLIVLNKLEDQLLVMTYELNSLKKNLNVLP